MRFHNLVSMIGRETGILLCGVLSDTTYQAASFSSQDGEDLKEIQLALRARTAEIQQGYKDEEEDEESSVLQEKETTEEDEDEAEEQVCFLTFYVF